MELFTEVEKTNRKIVIMGKRLKKIIDFAIENHYLYISKDIIGDLSNINDKNVVILNANEKDKRGSSKYLLLLPAVPHL